MRVCVVHDVRVGHRDLPIVGVGGVSSGWDAIELMAVGASAVGAGTASFVDPRAVVRVFDDMCSWAVRRGVTDLGSLTDRAHRP